MLPPALRRNLDAIAAATEPGARRPTPSVNAETLTHLAACCRDHEYATFDYVAHDGAATERRVEPHQLVSFEQRWYLVAWDTRRDDWRTFRLDRMRHVGVAGDRFRRREIPGGSALEYVRRSGAARPRRYAVEIHFAADADAVRAATGRWGDVTDDGRRATWRIALDTLDWPLMLIAQVDADATVVSPPELVDLVHASAQRMARTARPACSDAAERG